MIQDIKELDSNMTPAQVEEGLAWFDILPLGLEGQGWTETLQPYDRLPTYAKKMVASGVWELSKHSAGLCVRFVTDATAISARWTLRFDPIDNDHMAATGVSGLDLYARDQGRWRWIGISRAPKYPHSEAQLISNLSPKMREYMLYLPLYNGVSKVELGLPSDARLSRAPDRPSDKASPICFYGNSIVQGGCVSRPGMAYPAILGRRLDRPVINLGFSGNACSEAEVADLLAELDPALYVLDALPNMGLLPSPTIVERIMHMVTVLRRAHPIAPIVLVENIIYQHSPLQKDRFQAQQERNDALRHAFEQLLEQGVVDLHKIPDTHLLGDDFEGTVDGTHPTDLGSMRIAEALAPLLSRLLH